MASAVLVFVGLPAHALVTEEIAPGQAVEIGAGHVDVGPVVQEGKLRFMARDDTGTKPLWRAFDQTVLRVNDGALQTVPAAKEYAFLGETQGTQAHVIEQNQRSGVLWLGWNTMAPSLLGTNTRGVTYTLSGLQGPGDMTVFLQSGTFGEPSVLWTSTKRSEQPVWVDANTHTHANWVFTKPGVYLVRMQLAATLPDGRVLRDSQVMRFAIGDGASAEEALRARFLETAHFAPGEGGVGMAAGSGQIAEGGPAGNVAPGQDVPEGSGTQGAEAGAVDGGAAGGAGLDVANGTPDTAALGTPANPAHAGGIFISTQTLVVVAIVVLALGLSGFGLWRWQANRRAIAAARQQIFQEENRTEGPTTL